MVFEHLCPDSLLSARFPVTTAMPAAPGCPDRASEAGSERAIYVGATRSALGVDIIFLGAPAGRAASKGQGPSAVKPPRGPVQTGPWGLGGDAECELQKHLSITFNATLVMSPEAQLQSDTPGGRDLIEREWGQPGNAVLKH